MLDTYILRLVVSLEVWLDRLVLLIKLGQVWYKILNNVGVR